jgi:hypothetical protein
VSFDVVMAEQAQSLPLHDEIPAIEPRLFPHGVVGLGRVGLLVLPQAIEVLPPTLQLGEEALEGARDAGEGGGHLRPQLRLGPGQALRHPLHRAHRSTLPRVGLR